MGCNWLQGVATLLQPGCKVVGKSCKWVTGGVPGPVPGARVPGARLGARVPAGGVPGPVPGALLKVPLCCISFTNKNAVRIELATS